MVNITEDLQQDMSVSTREATHFTPEEILMNPFGTRKGEVMAWKRVSKSSRVDRLIGVAVI